jgi:Double zinc ribbon
MFLLSWPGGDWQATARIAVTILAVYLAAIWLTLVFWTYRDIRQRTRDPILQTVAVLLVLIFFLPGHWIYLIVRPRYTLTELYERSLEEEALLQDLEDQKACPTCKRRVQDEFLICPSCRTQLKETCRSCSKPLSYAWVACPFCGLEKPPREHLGARPARPATRPAAASHPQPQPRPVQPIQQQTQPAPQPIQRVTRDPFARTQPRVAGDEAPVIGE